MASEHFIHMGPPAAAQWLDLVEAECVELKESVKEMVSKAVEKALKAMRHSLTEFLREGQTLVTNKTLKMVDIDVEKNKSLEKEVKKNIDEDVDTTCPEESPERATQVLGISFETKYDKVSICKLHGDEHGWCTKWWKIEELFVEEKKGIMMMLVGALGSGKSTSCQDVTKISNRPWVLVCQDTIGNGKARTKVQCLTSASTALKEVKSVFIDRCNLEREHRLDLLKLGCSHCNVHIVVLDLPAKLCIPRCSKRTGHEENLQGGKAAMVLNRMLQKKKELISDVLGNIYRGEESLCCQFWDKNSFNNGLIRCLICNLEGKFIFRPLNLFACCHPLRGNVACRVCIQFLDKSTGLSTVFEIVEVQWSIVLPCL